MYSNISRNKLLLFILLFSSIGFSQQNLMPLNSENQAKYEKALLSQDQLSFTAIRPFLKSDLQSFINVDSIHYNFGRDSLILSKMKHPKWWRKLRTEDLLIIDESGFKLRMNFLMNFSGGKTDNGIDKEKISFNTRGVDISGELGKKFAFGSGVFERQAIFPYFVSDFINDRKVIPGQGRARTFQVNGFDYSQAYGYLSFTPNKVFNFQIGHGKHFIGEGYRSLILSDNSYNMPYVKFTTTWKWIRYTNLLMAYQNSKIADGTSQISNRRYGSVTSLDFLIGNFLELGITESIVWQKKQANSYLPDPGLYNPLIFYRVAQYGMNGMNNILLGVNSKFKITKSIMAYAQYVYDDKNKTAFQVGVKYYDVFKLPIFMQLEYNVSKPYTYSHWDKQSFTHYNQELVHPLGANFSEFVGRWRLKLKDLSFSYQFNYAQTGLDTANINYGSDILTINNEYQGTDLYQGLKTEIVNHSFTVAFLINPAVNLQVYFQYRIRSFVNEVEDAKESFYYFGLKTSLHNRYSDF